MGSRYFSDYELECHGDGCCNGGVDKINPILLEKLDKLREMVGGALELSCAYRCPIHNEEVGGVPNSQHVLGNGADVQTPNYRWCSTPEELAWYCEKVGFDAIGIYSWGCHVDVRDNGENPCYYRW